MKFVNEDQVAAHETATRATDQPRLRTIHSYVLREGRLTPAQERAFATDWATYGVDWDGSSALDLANLFASVQPVVLEIGFGNGESLLEMALANPSVNWLGLEMHRPGVGHLLIQAQQHAPTNLKVMRADAVALLRHGLKPESLAGIQLFFPDPWPKKRHHKRRIVSPENVALMVRALQPEGYLHAATDWQDYADHMLAVLEAELSLSNAAGAGQWSEKPARRPQTKFERRGLKLGHQVRDLIFIKRNLANP